MSKKRKPLLTVSKENRLKTAKRELEAEERFQRPVETKQTTVILEADLLYSAKEVALKRRKRGIEPNTITGMIREALQEIVRKELNG